MKFDPRTVSVLNNFNGIQSNIVIREGNVIKTMASNKTVYAKAGVVQAFEKQVAIYDLGRFLATLSLFTDPEIELHDSFLTMQTDENRVNYTYADPRILVSPDYEKNVVLPSVDVEFTMASSELTDVLKGLRVLKLPAVAAVGDGKNINLSAFDPKGAIKDVFNVTMEESDKKFVAVFRPETLS